MLLRAGEKTGLEEADLPKRHAHRLQREKVEANRIYKRGITEKVQVLEQNTRKCNRTMRKNVRWNDNCSKENEKDCKRAAPMNGERIFSRQHRRRS